MVDEARMEETDAGTIPGTDGWFVLHASEAAWMRSPRFGSGCIFEGPDAPFSDLGVNLRVLEPGKPACLYHREKGQENFFVLSGECVLIIEEEEHRLRAGDFVHCPPWTNHVFVGAGEQRCAMIMMGHRPETDEVVYPVSEVAARYGASVDRETGDAREAYGERDIEPSEPVWPLYGIG